MRVLCLAGGSSWGALQVGALQYLINDLKISYDAFAGISVGALNCSFLSLYPKSQEQEGFNNLLNIWNNLSNSKIRKNWFPLGMVSALWKDSIYNSQPLIDLVHNTLDLEKIRNNGRNISVGAVSMSSGKYRTFTQSDDCFVDGVLASSSYPMGLCPIVINGEKYTDGGVRHIVPTQEAISFNPTDIDIIACGPNGVNTKFNDVDVITFGMRCFDFMCDQITQSDIQSLNYFNQLNNNKINIKIIRPTAELSNDQLDFSEKNISSMLAQGYLIAKQQYVP